MKLLDYLSYLDAEKFSELFDRRPSRSLRFFFLGAVEATCCLASCFRGMPATAFSQRFGVMPLLWVLPSVWSECPLKPGFALNFSIFPLRYLLEPVRERDVPPRLQA